MSGTAVHFGAGNIGRGFVGLILHRAGYEVVFADVADALIDALAATPSYVVRAVGTDPHDETVDSYRAVNSRSAEADVIAEIAAADIVTTAVGPTVLRFVAPVIAAGLRARTVDTPLTVMACENAINATDVLAGEIRRHADDDWEALSAKAVFANTAVDRIVPAQAADAGLDVTVETYFEWAIEKPPFAGLPAGVAPVIPDATWVDDLGPYIERKLFTVNTGHASTAYHGYARASASSATHSPTPRCGPSSRVCWPRRRRCWSPSTSSRPRCSRPTWRRSSPGSRTHTCRTPSIGSAGNRCANCPATNG